MDYTLVNQNQMRHHRIDAQDNPCMYKPMGITCPQEDAIIPIYLSGTIFVIKLRHQHNNSYRIVLG